MDVKTTKLERRIGCCAGFYVRALIDAETGECDSLYIETEREKVQITCGADIFVDLILACTRPL